MGYSSVSRISFCYCIFFVYFCIIVATINLCVTLSHFVSSVQLCYFESLYNLVSGFCFSTLHLCGKALFLLLWIFLPQMPSDKFIKCTNTDTKIDNNNNKIPDGFIQGCGSELLSQRHCDTLPVCKALSGDGVVQFSLRLFISVFSVSSSAAYRHRRQHRDPGLTV